MSDGGSASPRVLVVDGEATCDVLEVVGVADGVVRVRTAYLFELGEELQLRIERDGSIVDATARVRAHVADGAPSERVTELELVDQGEPRKQAG